MVVSALLRMAPALVAGALLGVSPAHVFPPADAQSTAHGSSQGSSQYQFIAPRAVGNGAYGNLVAPPGSPDPNDWFANGSLDPDMNDNVGLNALVLPETQGSDRMIAGTTRDAVAPGDDVFAAGRGATATNLAPELAGGVPPGCLDLQLEKQLQTGGTFWGGQAKSTAPTQFPLGVLTWNVAGSRDPLALGPAGSPVNLPAEGPGGGWCRPPATAMSASSPIETQWFWILLLFPLMAVIVFGLSRGFRLRPIENTDRSLLSAAWDRQKADIALLPRTPP